MQEDHRNEIADLRTALDEKVGALAEEHQRERERAEELDRREARFNLAGPAALAFLGTLAQVVAVYFQVADYL